MGKLGSLPIVAILGMATLVGVAMVAAPVATATSSTLYVSPSASQNSGDSSCSTATYSTIQSAVAAASSGATVEVCTGTYTVDGATTSSIGGIDLFQPVTLEASGTVTITGTGPIFNLYNASSPSAGVTGVTIEGFDFQNITGSGYNGVITVGGYGAGDVTIKDNTFTNITDEAIGYHGNFGLTSPLGTNFDIVGNTVSNVTGSGTSARDGMFLGDLSNSVIADNTVSQTVWAGIILTGAAGVGSEGGNTIEGNTVSDVPEEGIQIAFGTNDTVSGNYVTNAGNGSNSGLAATAGYVSGRNCAICLYDTGQTAISVTDNVLTDSYQGVGVGQDNASPGALGSGIVVTHNVLVNDSDYGVVNNASSGTLPAVANWWGSHLGPTTAANKGDHGMAGVAVSANVRYAPWCQNNSCVTGGPG